MAKRKRVTTPEKQQKWMKEGRGQGIGKEYRPWVTIQDVPSTGKVQRIKGIKTGRIHHFLSNQESDYFFIIEYSDLIYDIREQYPLLPLEQTQLIADELGIKHPTDPKSQCPTVMTTDFLLTKIVHGQPKLFARTIKEKDKLMNKRVIEKFEIERRYWEKQEVDWGIVTNEEIDKAFAANISIVHSYYDLSDIDGFECLSKGQIQKITSEFRNELIGKEVRVREKAFEYEQKMMLPSGSALAIFKHLIMTKQIKVDLFTPFNIEIPQAIDLGKDFYDKEVVDG